MTDDEHHAALAAAIDRFRAIDPATFDEPVASCPGWTVADVIAHTAKVHRWATGIVTSLPTEAPQRSAAVAIEHDELLPAFAAGADALVAALHAADLDHPVFTWAGPGTVRWWLRRQAHETVVHAWDAQSPTGHPDVIDPTTAVDGIDELFDVFVPARFKSEVFAGSGETMHLHATDCEGEWLVRFDADAVSVSREHGKGDVAARGTAADLLLFVWGRAGTEPLETFGDATVLDRFRAVATF